MVCIFSQSSPYVLVLANAFFRVGLWNKIGHLLILTIKRFKQVPVVLERLGKLVSHCNIVTVKF